MRKKINIGLLVSVFLFGGILIVLSLQEHRAASTNSGIVIDTVRPIPRSEQMQVSHANDSLPYYQYVKLQDSLEQLARNETSKNTLHPGWGISAGSIGARYSWRTWYDYTTNEDHMRTGYHLSLTGYGLAESSSTEWKNGKSYLRYAVLDKENRVDARSVTRSWHSVTKEIPVMFLRENGELLVPVSEPKFSIVKKILFAVVLFFYFIATYILIGIPVNILLNISRGIVFTSVNIKGLHWISGFLLAYFLWNILSPYLMRFIFRDVVPDEFSLSLVDLLSSNWKTGIAGILVVAIGRAFSKGYILQHEQDLTV